MKAMNKSSWVGRLRVLASFMILCGAQAAAQGILLEAEAFDDLGGWVIDQQFMDQMGSPFLLAHGLGVPVADAVTMATLPQPGAYRVWVRTRDWVGPWKTPQTPPLRRASGTPGRFQVFINGEPLAATFGTEHAWWHWQDGGVIEITQSDVEVRLHDLTGFEGRCDAVLLTEDVGFLPPNEDPAMRQWRRDLLGIGPEPLDAGTFDLIVVGGGTAGMCATVQAARQGLTVALIQDRPVLGGNNSSEVRVWLNGETHFEPYPHIGDIMAEFEPARRAHAGPANTAEIYEDQKRIAMIQSEENVSLFLNHRVNAVEMDDNRITAVIAQNIQSGRLARFAGTWFADCTGDGCVGYLAGADYEMTLDGHMGPSNLWNVIDTGAPSPFPRCPWALDLSSSPFPSGESQLGVWYWESGFYHDPFQKGEYIRDWNFRAMYGAWDALKNVKGQFPNHRLNWAAYIAGKRESRRLLGDVILGRDDFVNHVEYPDGCVPCTWKIDLHLPDPRYDDGWEGDEFISRANYTNYNPPYWIPYRCLYSRNIDNLFMAGRDISVTHEGLGAVRVMRTGGMMGEVVGLAAALCKKHGTTPRGVYTNHLAELQRTMGRTVAVRWLETIGPNLARTAQVGVSSNYDPVKYPKEHINDGRLDTADNSQRWLSSASSMPDVVTFSWAVPQTISALRIVSGYYSAGTTGDPISAFHLEYHDGAQWSAVEGASVSGNRRAEILLKFPAVRSHRFRVVVTETHMDISRIWEIEFYHPCADLNGDGQMDLEDLGEVVWSWLITAEALAVDMDASGHVDMGDAAILAEFWLWP